MKKYIYAHTSEGFSDNEDVCFNVRVQIGAETAKLIEAAQKVVIEKGFVSVSFEPLPDTNITLFDSRGIEDDSKRLGTKVPSTGHLLIVSDNWLDIRAITDGVFVSPAISLVQQIRLHTRVIRQGGEK